MPKANVRGWSSPRYYKSVSDAQSDYFEAMRRVTEGISMIQSVADTLNETNPGQGDILYGVAATLLDTVEDVAKAGSDIKSALHGEEVNSFRAKKLMREAIRKAPTVKARRAIRQRQKVKPAT